MSPLPFHHPAGSGPPRRTRRAVIHPRTARALPLKTGLLHDARRATGSALRVGALLVALAGLCEGPATAQPADSTATREGAPKRVGLAVQQTLLSNLVVNRLNAWALGERWAREVDFETWSRNLRLGWEWDEDAFSTNMFGHPYQGASYFNAGRANGLSYWESVPLTFFGSWTWEYFGETFRPSLNDFFMTTFGGVSVGEMTHRVAATIRDEQARGVVRITREVVALVVDPMGGFNRLVRGQWTRVGPNPPEHDPGAFSYGYHAGVRNVYEDSTGTGNVAPTLLIDVRYGDAFDRRYREPFDVFSMHLQFSPGGGGLNALQTTGRLYQAGLPSWSARNEHAFSVDHRFDYLNNPVFRFGGQHIEVGLLSRFPLPGGFSLRARLASSFLVMGAISAPPDALKSDSTRAYDFGPGVGAMLSADLMRGGHTYLSLYNRAEYLHSVSGTPADHIVAFTGLKGTLPLYNNFGVGLDLSADARESRYTDLPGISRQFIETRVFVSWTSSRKGSPAEDR